MSGFEIAGVVLGSFPLLISTCENYKKGFEPLVKWKRFRTDFIGFIDAVEIENFLFSQVLERFLLGTGVVDHEELQHFLAHPGYEGWHREDLADALSRRLGPSMLMAFMSTIKTMNSLVLQLQDLLLLKNKEIHWADEGSKRWDYQMKRVQLSFSKKGNNILTSLETHNRKLRELLDSNEKSESMKITQKDTKWGTIFECIRAHAKSLHMAIRAGFCCTCPDHAASLRLEQRNTGEWTSNFNLAFSVPDSTRVDCKLRREVVLKARQSQHSPSTEIVQPQCNTKDVEYETMANLRTHFESTSSPQLGQDLTNPRPSLTTTISGPSSHTSSRIRFRERFSKTISNSSNSTGTECYVEELQISSPASRAKPRKQVRMAEALDCSAMSPLPQTPITRSISTQKIENLCYAISCSTSTSECLGYLTDGKQEHELHQLTSDVLLKEHYVSLEDLLSGSSGSRLTRQQRYKLASILASSLLQLQTTPWLSGKMNKKNIFFYGHSTKVNVEYPYIKHSFSLSNDVSMVLPQTVDRLAVRNSLSNLGILLLELCFGQTIEAQELRKPYLGQDGKPGEYTDFMTARDWAEFVEEEEPAFEQIIKCCMFNKFEEKADWENKKYTQAVYSSVVAPLDDITAKWSAI